MKEAKALPGGFVADVSGQLRGTIDSEERGTIRASCEAERQLCKPKIRSGNMMADEPTLNAVELATELTIAWLGNQNNRVSADDVPTFLRTMHSTVAELAAGSPAPTDGSEESASEPEHTPAITARKSLSSKDFIVSMIDGKPYKTLRRHLGKHGLTPEQYRQRYNLKPDYPMVAENYSTARREMAHKIGLGQKGRQARAASADAAQAQSARRPRKSKSEPA